MKTQLEKSAEFVNPHHKSSCFVIPNPWDIDSAKLLEHLGFKAFASTGLVLRSHKKKAISASTQERRCSTSRNCARAAT